MHHSCQQNNDYYMLMISCETLDEVATPWTNEMHCWIKYLSTVILLSLDVIYCLSVITSAEMQTRWIVDVFTGATSLPSFSNYRVLFVCSSIATCDTLEASARLRVLCARSSADCSRRGWSRDRLCWLFIDDVYEEILLGPPPRFLRTSLFGLFEVFEKQGQRLIVFWTTIPKGEYLVWRWFIARLCRYWVARFCYYFEINVSHRPSPKESPCLPLPGMTGVHFVVN